MRSFLLIVVLATVIACNPFDPPLYKTPLPNGYEQWSNGGEFGALVKPKPIRPTAGKVIAPIGPGPNGRDRWCDTFGWNENLVVCEVTEYADRAFVDPPLSREYLMLDTTNGSVVYYKTRSELVQVWSATTVAPLPPLVKEHSSRTRL
jgi:hypothetical protein